MPIRPAIAALRPFVAALWTGESPAGRPGQVEHNLPDGRMHLVIRLEGDPLRLYDDDTDTVGRTVADAVVAGPYSRAYLKDVATSARSLGVVLGPGAARALFGCDPAELHDRHCPLELLWPAACERLRDQLDSETDPQRQLDQVQAALLARLRPRHGLHPQVAMALQGLRQGRRVGDLVDASGYSHRRFIDLFRGATGMPPAIYARLLRFRRALRLAAGEASWTGVALDAGYSDQAHLIREFRAFSGLTPRTWRAAQRRHGSHVRLPPGC